MNPFVEKALKGKVKQHEKTGGIMINKRLQVHDAKGKPISGVYALGDCAASGYPATAQVASQQALWIAKRLNKGDIDRQEFRYNDLGVMAYIGNQKAIMHSGAGDISGRIAWLIWRGAYLTKTVSWRNKILIPVSGRRHRSYRSTLCGMLTFLFLRSTGP